MHCKLGRLPPFGRQPQNDGSHADGPASIVHARSCSKRACSVGGAWLGRPGTDRPSDELSRERPGMALQNPCGMDACGSPF